MGARFDRSAEPFALVASRIEPASLRNQIPRNGGRFLFPYGVDSLMLLAASDAVLQSYSHTGASVDSGSLQGLVLEKLKAALQSQTSDSSSIKWGMGTRHVLENASSIDGTRLRSNCGISRALVAGLVDPFVIAEPLCAATHSHPTAIEGAKTVAQAVHLALHEDRPIRVSDFKSSIPSYASSLAKAIDLATNKPYDGDDDFSTRLQERFVGQFGSDASSQCAVAASTFALYRTIHSLPYLDASSKEYLRRIQTVTKAGEAKAKKGVAMNTLGNSNRMDTESLFSKLTPSIEQDLPVSLAVGWSISLGGDTRTNACLAGGLAGAIWGEEGIPDEWLMFCEGVDAARTVADALYSLKH